MNEQHPDVDLPEEQETGHDVDESAPDRPSGAGDPPVTGVPALDEVLAEVSALDDVPIAGHPDAYERAHTTLRAVLDGRAEQTER